MLKECLKKLVWKLTFPLMSLLSKKNNKNNQEEDKEDNNNDCESTFIKVKSIKINLIFNIHNADFLFISFSVYNLN